VWQVETSKICGWARLISENGKCLENSTWRAQGWLVAGGDFDDGKLVWSSKAAHVVIRPGTEVIRNKAFRGCSGMVSVGPTSVSTTFRSE
jgi:hypothetical protein